MADDNAAAYGFLGVPAYEGPGHPDKVNNFPTIKTNRDLIRDSVLSIILTRLGQRFMVPDYGCGIYDLIFEPNDTVATRLFELKIKAALNTWEPRVQVRNVSVRLYEHNVEITLVLRIIRLNETMTLPISVDRSRFFNIIE